MELQKLFTPAPNIKLYFRSHKNVVDIFKTAGFLLRNITVNLLEKKKLKDTFDHHPSIHPSTHLPIRPHDKG